MESLLYVLLGSAIMNIGLYFGAKWERQRQEWRR